MTKFAFLGGLKEGICLLACVYNMLLLSGNVSSRKSSLEFLDHDIHFRCISRKGNVVNICYTLWMPVMAVSVVL